ncbi:Elongation factor P--(R)-beta-lysine ligase [Novipirellula aureliae]|uniref:Elongation factor P--(R)-beta-lysine ligase n=1 Tax=Novipirellula aureliae TaxID=2527966 RepID=A0A5C6EAT8_9BACT|nr:EF-P lysine aminoacylase EpmA [Novipirellula aureliae]TWU45998.1 Elongation factor P--(R)-beta-lysine ligase [Novipirellula aureliae]
MNRVNYQQPDLSLLRQRARLLHDVRAYFDDRGFYEVQPPCLASDCIVDPYIDPITIDTTQLLMPSRDLSSPFYLQTSPELSMKRMLAAGAPSIYSVGPVFRAGERGDMHNIEFTMLEWYDVGADIESGIQTLGGLVCETLKQPHFECITYRDLFETFLGFDPISVPSSTLVTEASRIDGLLAERMSEDRDSLLDLLFSSVIQPSLGLEAPVIIKNYPLSQAALARSCQDDPECAARFELFFEGVELANGYDELLDADVLLERSRIANQRRAMSGRPLIEIDSSLVSALRQGMPASTGVAMGFDRLLMVATKSVNIHQVIPFPIERA